MNGSMYGNANGYGQSYPMNYGSPYGGSFGFPYGDGYGSPFGSGYGMQGYGNPFGGGYGGGYGMQPQFGGFGMQPFQGGSMFGSGAKGSMPMQSNGMPNFAAKGGQPSPATPLVTLGQSGTTSPSPNFPNLVGHEMGPGMPVGTPTTPNTLAGTTTPNPNLLSGGNPMGPVAPPQMQTPLPQAAPPMSPVSALPQTPSFGSALNVMNKFNPGFNSSLPGIPSFVGRIGGFR